MMKLRPQDMPKRCRAKYRKNYGHCIDWQTRQKNSENFKKYMETTPLNERFSGKVFSVIHYLSSRALKKVNRRWKQAGIRWDRKMCRHASIRFANFFTINRWLL